MAEDTETALRVYGAASPTALIVLGHGAGAGQASAFMVHFAGGLAERGVSTATFDFPYITARRKVPDRTPVLESAWRATIERASTIAEGLGVPLFIGGKSMGGRIASHIAAQESPRPLSGLVLLGYPLHPPGRPAERRDAHLPRISIPMLFVQGSRDAFGTSEEMRELLPTLARATLHEVEGGDHSFKVPGGAAANGAVLTRVMDVVADWIAARVHA